MIFKNVVIFMISVADRHIPMILDFPGRKLGVCPLLRGEFSSTPRMVTLETPVDSDSSRACHKIFSKKKIGLGGETTPFRSLKSIMDMTHGRTQIQVPVVETLAEGVSAPSARQHSHEDLGAARIRPPEVLFS